MSTSGLGQRVIRELQNHLFGKAPDTTPAGVVFVTLFEGDPGVDGQGGTEANGAGFARVATTAATWNVATLADPSLTDNALAVLFATATGDWNAGADFDHFAIFTTLTGTTEADFVCRGELTTAQPVLNGQTPNFPPGSIQILGTDTP